MTMRSGFARLALIAGVVAVILGTTWAPETAAQEPERRGRFGGLFPDYEPDDNTGFVPIFDGKTLAGWEGEPAYWRVENGALVGEITPATVIRSNTFIIWRGGSPADVWT